MRTRVGQIKLFTLMGITVYLDWLLWLVIGVALYYWQYTRSGNHHSAAETIGLNVCLFAIVLMHEFGHALACHSVGGKADRIVLWPLGGIAYVNPPPRPGAVLWCIAAGPLVNVALVPVTLLILYACQLAHAAGAVNFAWIIVAINLGLLIFNMLPIYPLDGGQILQSLIWFVVGRAWSLLISGVIGLLGAVGFALIAIVFGEWWFGMLGIFLATMALRGLRFGLALRRLGAAPRHALPRCPACHENPPAGAFWRCSCGNPFDVFASSGFCPRCGRNFPTTACPRCGGTSPLPAWFAHVPQVPAPSAFVFSPAIVPPPPPPAAPVP